MTASARKKRCIRSVVSWAFYALLVGLNCLISWRIGIDVGAGLVLFMIGYLAGRITKGTER